MFAIVPSLSMVLALFGQGQSPDTLDLKISLQAHLSRLDSLHLCYDQLWTPSPNVRIPASKSSKKRRLVGVPDDGQQEGAVPEVVVSECEVWWDSSAVRLDNKSVFKKSGRKHSDSTHIIKRDGSVYYEDHMAKNATSKSAGSRPSTLPLTPLIALGIFMPDTSQEPLYSLLDDLSCVKQEGREKHGSIDTVVLKIGPGIPDDICPFRSDREHRSHWVRLWLAPTYSYQPVKVEYHRAGSGGKERSFLTTQLAEFRPVQDALRGADIILPSVITQSDPGGATRWTISDVSVNQRFGKNVFNPTPRSGYVVSSDRPGVPVRLAGGPIEKARLVSRTSNEAGKLLDSSPPPRQYGAVLPWALTFGLGLAIVILAGILLKRRTGRA